MDKLNENDLRQLGFIRAGLVTKGPEDETITITLDESFLKNGEQYGHRGWVYLWIKTDEKNQFEVCYVGKAGRSLATRCRQHENGFCGKAKSARGLENGRRVREYLDQNKRSKILVLARHSAEATILGEPDISMCESEERAMLTKLRKLGVILWNSV